MSEVERRWTLRTNEERKLVSQIFLLDYVNELRGMVKPLYELKVSLEGKPLLREEYNLVSDALEKVRKALASFERLKGVRV